MWGSLQNCFSAGMIAARAAKAIAHALILFSQGEHYHATPTGNPTTFARGTGSSASLHASAVFHARADCGRRPKKQSPESRTQRRREIPEVSDVQELHETPRG